MLLLPIGVMAGSDNYSMKFIIPTDTSTPTSSGGGGSGGDTGIIYEFISPPMVSVIIKNLGSSTTELGLIIKNEGKHEFEYGYLWYLEKYNETTKNYTSIEKRRMSKLLKPGELSEIPITFNGLDNGKYNFNVNVEYGTSGKNDGYISKASVEFTTKNKLLGIIDTNQIHSTPNNIKENIGYTTAIVVGLIGIVALKYKMRFRVRK